MTRNIAQSSTALEQGKLFTRFLDTIGDGTGLKNANWEFGVDIGDATFDFVDGGVDDEWTLNAHGLTTGVMVYFDAVGTGAGPFVVDTYYFAIRVDANTFQLASTYANAIAGTQIEGTADSAGAWSLTVGPGWFKIDPAADEVMVITNLTVHMLDTKGGLPDEYGDTAGVLTNGLAIDLLDVDGTSIIDFTGGHPITMGAEFSHIFDPVELVAGTTNQSYAYRLNFPGRYGQELRLVGAGEDNCYFQVTCTDDLSGLIMHHFVVQGYYESGEQLR